LEDTEKAVALVNTATKDIEVLQAATKSSSKKVCVCVCARVCVRVCVCPGLGKDSKVEV